MYHAIFINHNLKFLIINNKFTFKTSNLNMSSAGYDNFDEGEVWNNAPKPKVSFIGQSCIILFASIWPALFGIFTFKTDVACPNNELLTFTTISFWLFLVISILSVINAIMQIVTFDNLQPSLYFRAISYFILAIVLGISLFIFFRGMIVLQNATPEVDCKAVYYLVLVYVLLWIVAITIIRLIVDHY